MDIRQGRDAQLDLIRGVAILGIALLNVFSFAIPSFYSFDLYWHQQAISALDEWLYQLQHLFLQGRFRTLLTLLFGVGLWLVAMPTLISDGKNLLAHQQKIRRRYLALALFGFCHISFFWSGDITFWYALSALLLLAFGFLKLTASAQWCLGLALILISVLMNYAAAWAYILNAPTFELGLSDEEIMTEQALQQGPILELWQQMFFENMLTLVGFCTNLAWLNIGTMLIGISLYRQGFFQNGMSRWQEILLLLIALSLDYCGLIISAGFYTLLNFWYDFSALLMAFVFCSWLVKWRNQGWLTRWLQICGQMALSLYFLQTLLFLLWFRMLNPAWYANAERWQLMSLACVVMLLSLGFAVGWRHFFRLGPLEWCWRRFYQRPL